MHKLLAKIAKDLTTLVIIALTFIQSGCSRCALRICENTNNFHSISNSSEVMYEDNADSLASKLSIIVSPAILHVEKWSGGSFVNKHNIIYACATHDSFQSYTRKGDLKAANTCNKIFISPTVSDVEMFHIIKHELSHLYLEQHLGCENWYSMPAWLQEAIAEYISNKGENNTDKAKVVNMFKYLARKDINKYSSIADVYSKHQWGDSRLVLADFLDYIDSKHDKAVSKYLIFLSNISNDTVIESFDTFLEKIHGINIDLIYKNYISR